LATVGRWWRLADILRTFCGPIEAGDALRRIRDLYAEYDAGGAS
jgi:hypothetical protein